MSTAIGSGAGRRLAPALLVAGGIALACAATAAGVGLTGAAAPSVLVDPGAVVRWGLPLVRALGDLAAALTIGLLALTCVALPVAGRRLAYQPALLSASAAAGVWAVSTLATAVLTYADVSGMSMGDPTYGQQLSSFLFDIDLGRGLAVTALAAAIVATFAAGVRTLGSAGLLLLVALAGLIPPALSGHAAGASDHETAVTALGLHLLGVCVWVGGLAGLVLLRRGLSGPALAVAAGRFSTLATWCFATVALSGVVNAWIRVGSPAGMRTRYGVLVVAKVVGLVVLGAFGLRHRRRTLPQLAAGRSGAFARLAVVEAAVMAVAVGVAVALARSAPPVPNVPPARPSLAQALTGYPMPPPPTPLRWLTQWQPDLLWVVLIGLALVLYPLGVHRLHARGDRWSPLRTTSWLSGVVVLTWVTCGPPAVYGRVLFSAHMIGHMTLSMAVPLLLTLGAPVTLLARAATPRHDGSRGAREWVLAVVESRYMRVLTHPVVVSALFAFSLIFFYFSNLFVLALTTHVGHELMHVHFLFAGYLLAWVMVGIDPGPRRPSPLMRLVLLFVTMGFHSFFGIALIMGRSVLAAHYFGGLGRTWGAGLLADQQYGGGIAWGIGEIPTLALALIMAIQWTQSDGREARRLDRAADRDGDAELKEYNAMLARLAEADTNQPER